MSIISWLSALELLLGVCLGVELLSHMASIHSTLLNNAELSSSVLIPVYKQALGTSKNSTVLMLTTLVIIQ